MFAIVATVFGAIAIIGLIASAIYAGLTDPPNDNDNNRY